MPRSIWKGAISFGLVTIPIKLYSATEEKDISFRQVHPEDGGRIKYKRVCEKCNKEIPYAEIAKGYELPDGRMVILTSEDFDDLPLTTTKAVEVVQFVAEEEVDPTYFAKTYFLQADGPGIKPYVLLRDALTKSAKSALVKVALRSREALALIRPKDDVLLMHTMLWPDELRDGGFAAPPADVTVSDAEVTMAQSFIDALSGDFEPRGVSRLLSGGAGDAGPEQGGRRPARGRARGRGAGRGRRPGRRAPGVGRGGQEASGGRRGGVQGRLAVAPRSRRGASGRRQLTGPRAGPGRCSRSARPIQARRGSSRAAARCSFVASRPGPDDPFVFPLGVGADHPMAQHARLHGVPAESAGQLAQAARRRRSPVPPALLVTAGPAIPGVCCPKRC